MHLHCLIPGGALTEAGDWNPAKSNYLFPVKALFRYFRGRMVSQLRQSAERGELHRVTRPTEVDTLLNSLMQCDWVEFRYKDYQDHNRNKVMGLDGEEFIRRFLLHILPKGFMRIRHYDFIANRCRKNKLAQIRQWLRATDTSDPAPLAPAEIAPRRIDYGGAMQN